MRRETRSTSIDKEERNAAYRDTTVGGSLGNGFRLRDWEVYPRQNRLKGPRGVRTIEPKVMDVLVLLAERQGDIVSRDDFLALVWTGVVVGEEVVSRAISVLRAELGDNPTNPVYVRTISKRGYCLVANAEPLPLEDQHGPQRTMRAPDSSTHASRVAWLALLVFGAVALGLGYVASEKFGMDPDLARSTDGEGIGIAVLPFVNMSNDAIDDYFAEGLSEELLDLLIRIPDFRVVARTSSFFYKGKDVPIEQIGEELGASYLLTGSVRRSNNQVRISVRLIEVDTELHVWSETYERTLDDIFKIQDEIASSVAEAIEVRLVDGMPATSTTGPEVYALYLQGRHFQNLKGIENFDKSARLLQQALAIDPDYAPAWVALTETYNNQVRAGVLAREQGRSLAFAATEKALALNPESAAAWATLAYQKRYYDLDWEGALAALDKALRLEPNNAQVLGVAASLAAGLGRVAEATILHERALAQDPLNLTALSAMGRDYLRTGRLDEAIRMFNRLVELNPDHLTVHTNLGRAYFLKGDIDRALAEIDKSRSQMLKTFERIQIYRTIGDQGETQRLVTEYLERYAHIDAIRTAELFASLGDNDSAFDSLNTALEKRDVRLAWFLVSVHLRKLEGDPRYAAFLEKLGLLGAWEAMSLHNQQTGTAESS